MLSGVPPSPQRSHTPVPVNARMLLGSLTRSPARHLSHVIEALFSSRRHSEQLFFPSSPPFSSHPPPLPPSAPLQEWSKSICLTFVHNIWPLGYSAVQLINNATSAHVFPLYDTEQEGTHHPACYYPAPSTTMSPFSRSSRGDSGPCLQHGHSEIQ